MEGTLHCMLSKEKDEISDLENSTLEAEIQNFESGRKLGKKFSLRKTDEDDLQLTVKYIPPGSDWEQLMEIQAVINKSAYEALVQYRRTTLRHSIGSLIIEEVTDIESMM